MKYKDKRDETVIARVESENEKYGTITMVYETGPNEGKTFDITNATLKRWWSPVQEEKSEAEILHLDMETINEPYPEPKKKKYIPKPESVVEYEKKKRGRKYNEAIPEFEQIVEAVGSICCKVNETSQYVKLNDKVTTIWRKTLAISIYAGTDTAEKLAKAGFTSAPNKDKDRPFAFKIETKEDFDKVVGVLKEE